ncbi:TRAP transporter small permease [Cereibacter sphaeroides]|uniref:TRAP transporter small permease n=1 Tax=Cereibacter sphaeroides TaxID=1063 RepID=UPI000E5B2188|nr:TRAP transporter small permease [Cereibacter sphaeroides]RHZ93975.1 TRAP transporter small permease [Cereibacter sphaeroides]
MSDPHATDLPAPAPPRALDLTVRALFGVATALLLLIVALIVAQVLARNLWNMGLPKAEEAARLAGVLAVYFTAPLLALRGQHVAVEVFTSHLPRGGRIAAMVLAETATLAFAALTIWGGWLYLGRAWKFRTSALGLPNIWYFGPVMACFALLAVIAGWRILAALRQGRALS